MFARTFHPGRLIRSVQDTSPFREYCLLRSIPDPLLTAIPGEERDPWAAALQALAPDTQARVELEMAEINELAGHEGNTHLLDAGEGREPPPLDVPAGAPLALWYLLHHPDLFHEVFLHHEIRSVRSWRIARAAAHVRLDDPGVSAARLASGLREFFRLDGGAGRYCAVDAHHIQGVHCFTAHVADRICLVESFSESGRLAVKRVRPALTLLFTYNPSAGTVRLKSPLRSIDRLRGLFQCFGTTVLSAPVEIAGSAFDLDRLKHPFRPLPDAADMEVARVKSLHLCYPARLGRRQVKLETLSTDAPTAIEELLRAHAGTAVPLDELRVSHAELQVRLRYRGRSKVALIRLWPDRSSLNDTPLGRRLSACLRQWGLADD